jgi:hypothetical protein
MSRDENKDFDFESCFDSKADKSLRAYFGRVVKGTDVDVRTPFYNGEDRAKILDQWQKVLEPGLAGMEGLLEFENDLRGKVGPLSIMKPLSERMEDIDAYYDSIHQESKPINPEAIDALLKQWEPRIGGLKAKQTEATWLQMKKSTSSGSPFFTKRRNVISKTLPALVYADMSQDLHDRTYNMCAILGWRGQEGGPDDSDVRQRVIWMFPMAANIQEHRFYQPLIAACQTTNLVPAWNGNDAVDEEITLLFDSKGKNDVIICTDFTKFDQHFGRPMQECARTVLSKLFTRDEVYSYWFGQVFPIKYEIPLAYEWGSLRFGSHGMASGSGGTNADETLSHKCLQLEAAITSGAKLNPHSMCLGDDGLLSYPGIDLDHVLDVYTSKGLEMNESKQSVSKDECTYLRRWYSTDYRIEGKCRGVYSTYRALGKLMGQERFYDPDLWSPEMVVLRELSILENVKWHPMREQFLEFCVKGDKYRLGLDIPGFLDNLAKVYESNELAQSFKSYTAGDGHGIESWWVVNALKAMR